MPGGSADVLAGWENVVAPPKQATTTPIKPKDGGLKGLLESFLPAVGGTVGAIGGSLLGPLGTAGGGAAGSGFGEFLKEKLSGEKTNFGSIAKQSALGALPGAVEGLSGGIAGAKAGEGFLSGLVKGKAAIAATQAGTEGLANGAEQLATRGAKVGNTVRNAAQEADAAASGFGVGSTINGKVITPDRANELYDFARNGSSKYAEGAVKAGSPLSQAQKAQEVFGGVKNSLSSKLEEINRPLVAGEAENVAQNAIAKVTDSGMVTGKTPTLDKFVQKVTALEGDGDIKGLEKIRQEADNVAYTKTGAGKTSAAAQAHAIRDAIDEFVTPFSEDYKNIKGDYSKARDLLELTSKGVKSTDSSFGGSKGLFSAITNNPLTKGVESKGASILAGNNTVKAGNFLGTLTKQSLSHGIGGQLLDPATQEQPAIASGLDSLDTASTADTLPDTSAVPDDSPFSPNNVQENIQKIVAQGGTMKDVSDYLGVVKTVTDLQTSSGTKLPAAQQTLLSNAQRASGLLDTVYQQFQSLGGAQGRVGGFISGLTGKAGLNDNVNAYNTARTDAAIPLAQALSGSTRLPPPETLKIIEDMLPNFGDNPKEVEVKKQLLQQRLSSAIQAIQSGSLTPAS